MSTRKTTPSPVAASPRGKSITTTNPAAAAKSTPPAASTDWLLVCLQDPFDAAGDSSLIARQSIPAAATGNTNHRWQIEAVLEMNPPKVFEGWATRATFTLDLRVHASVSPEAGAWGGHVRTNSGSGQCRVMILRDPSQKVRFSLATGARHATEKNLPNPEPERFLNADVAFEMNGNAGIQAAAVALVSKIPWSHLIAGSSAASLGLAFDSKWRRNMEPADGDATAIGAWALAVMTRTDYESLCASQGWSPRITDAD